MGKSISKAIALVLLYKEEEDEISLRLVIDCFNGKRNAEVDFIDKH